MWCCCVYKSSSTDVREKRRRPAKTKRVTPRLIRNKNSSNILPLIALLSNFVSNFAELLELIRLDEETVVYKGKLLKV